MDISLARTFLEVVRSGSLIAASEQLHVTQAAVTARIQSLESQLNCRLFVRNRGGARLTRDGELFVTYANQLVQTWEAAQRDLPLIRGIDSVLHLGCETSLYNPLMLHWVRLLRAEQGSQAVHTEVGEGAALQRRLEQGTLDAALVFQPSYWPGLQVEELLEEKLIQVCLPSQPEPYIYIDWGEAFRQQHDRALPDKAKAELTFNLGPMALQYLLSCGGSGYFRTRVVQSYLDSGQLQRVPRAPEFSFPAWLVYPRERDSEALQQAIALLRRAAADSHDWSQRWG
ncbi:LysR family transcriptional regulator [Halopseudomonas pachastrellae]|uniref:LysR family transcriptional regulator n=1 Tax=Halopseudomonas pachastrellae TaxID=254161 RepID=A0A1S8DHM1_9GAMM|nr:LysR family transcriptional regulator [Halopseudomonas pachastrellae]ONM44349.1 LysR family transcriptional regulator [Halopseudomonas pachastrellae]SFM11268.1 DNA-binding transcriptional regulator, LysR family [Halopseudomonas pachastrellae]